MTIKLTKHLFQTLAIAVLVASCAKSKPYDTVFRGVQKPRPITDFDTSATYLYMPQNQDVSMNNENIWAHMKGGQKLVKMRMAKEGIEIYEVQTDKRFASSINENIVLTIPGTYHEYRCATDNDGNCTNREEENTEVDWNQKSFFKEDLASLQVGDPSHLELYFNDTDCYIPFGKPKVVDKKIERGVLNIFIEKTYKVIVNNECAGQILTKYDRTNTPLESLTVKARQSYSIVDINKLASKDYEPIEYDRIDQEFFGFFSTEQRKFAYNLSDMENTNKTFLNRWNPKRKEIVFHLNKNFYKPENAHFLRATKKSIFAFNLGLEKANIKLRLKLKNGSDKRDGDLLTNMIYLEDQPSAHSIFGQGPAIKNPLTGEIVHAGVTMFKATFTKYAEETWDEMRAITIAKVNEKNPLYGSIDKSISVDLNAKVEVAEKTSFKDLGDENELNKAHNKSLKDHQQIDLLNPNNLITPTKEEERLAHSTISNHIKGREFKGTFVNKLIKKMDDNLLVEADVQNEISFNKKTLEQKRKLHANLSKKNIYLAEFMNVAHTAKTVIYTIKKMGPNIYEKSGALKSWDQLTLPQKKVATNHIAEHAFKATLVHELGHTLGLRHNFKGSWDNKNFYTDAEARTMGMDKAPATSTVMEYIPSALSDSMIIGKYDIAALRYAYNREVQLKDGTFAKIKTSILDLKKPIKSYDYCDDESAGSSISCQKHSMGSNPVEVVKFIKDRYEKSFRNANFRGKSKHFRRTTDINYLIFRLRSFGKYKKVLESYDRYAKQHGSDKLPSIKCTKEGKKASPEMCKNLDHIYEATMEAADHLVNIVTMPDLTCALASEKEPKKVIKTIKLADLLNEGMPGQLTALLGFARNREVKSCFDKLIVDAMKHPKMVVVGETGKYLNDLGGAYDDYTSSIDLSARGMWLDKIAALITLVDRSSPATKLSFMDLKEVQAKISLYISSLINKTPYQFAPLFTTQDGRKFRVPLDSDYKESIDGFFYGFAPYREEFSLNPATDSDQDPKTPFLKVLLGVLDKFSRTENPAEKDSVEKFRSIFNVTVKEVYEKIDHKDFRSEVIGDKQYIKNKRTLSVFNKYFLLQEGKEKIDEIVKGATEASKTAAFDRIIEHKVSPQAPKNYSELQKEIFAYDNEKLNLMAVGFRTNVFQQFESIKEQGHQPTRESLMGFFNNAKIVDFYLEIFAKDLAYLKELNQLAVEGIQEIVNTKNSIVRNGPLNQTDIEKKLLKISLKNLKLYKDGKFPEKIEQFKNIIPLLPRK